MNSPESILGPEWKKDTHGKVPVVAMTPDATYVAAGSEDHDVYLMDHGGKLRWATTTGDDVELVKISEDGRIVSSYSKDSVISYFNKNGEIMWTYRVGRHVNCMDMSSDGSLIVAGSDDGMIRAFNSSGEIIWSKNCSKPVLSVSISGSGALVIVGVATGRVFMFQKDGHIRWEYAMNSPVVYVYTSYDGEYSYALEYMNNTLHQLSDRGFELSKNSYSQSITDISITEDGRYAAIGFSNSYVYMTDKNGNLQWKQNVSGAVVSIKITPDSSLIFATTSDKSIYIFNKRGEVLLTYQFEDIAYGLATSYNGDYFAVGAYNFIYMFGIVRYLQYIAREQVKILKLIKEDEDKALKMKGMKSAPITGKAPPKGMNVCRKCGEPVLSGRVLCNYCEMMQRRGSLK
jgi:WD40 repeat protein